MTCKLVGGEHSARPAGGRELRCTLQLILSLYIMLWSGCLQCVAMRLYQVVSRSQYFPMLHTAHCTPTPVLSHCSAKVAGVLLHTTYSSVTGTPQKQHTRQTRYTRLTVADRPLHQLQEPPPVLSENPLSYPGTPTLLTVCLLSADPPPDSEKGWISSTHFLKWMLFTCFCSRKNSSLLPGDLNIKLTAFGRLECYERLVSRFLPSRRHAASHRHAAAILWDWPFFQQLTPSGNLSSM